MSDYMQGLLQLGQSARGGGAANINRQNPGPSNWLDAYGQGTQKAWGDYYGQYRDAFGGKAPAGFQGGGAGTGGTNNLSPGNPQSQWQQSQINRQINERLNEYQEWMEKYWQQQNRMQQGFQQPQIGPQLTEYMRRLEEIMEQNQNQNQGGSLPEGYIPYDAFDANAYEAWKLQRQPDYLENIAASGETPYENYLRWGHRGGFGQGGSSPSSGPRTTTAPAPSPAPSQAPSAPSGYVSPANFDEQAYTAWKLERQPNYLENIANNNQSHYENYLKWGHTGGFR